MIAPLHLVVCGFHEPYHDAVWRTLFERFPVASLEAVLADRTPTVPAPTRLIVHRFADLSLRADYGDAPTTPLDATLIDAMAPVETVFLRMCDRLEAAGPASYAQRKALYLRHLAHWNHVLTTRPVSAALFSNIPHETYDFVLFELCRRRGVPTLCFHQTQVEDAFIALEDWRDPLPGASARVRELAGRPESATAPFGLEGRYLAHFEKQTTAASPPVPFYMQPPRKAALSRVASEAWAQLAKPSGWRTAAYRAYLAQREAIAQRRLDEAYAASERPFDPRRPYIYVPLHYQPELTTSPLAGAYVDQALIVELLHAVARDTEIYVKEHPKQGTIARSPELYRRLAALPRVRLVPKSSSTYDLIAGARAVATCTGTAGWEALFRGKPVLMFGDYLYRYAPGVHRIHSRADLERALNEIDDQPPTLRGSAAFLRVLAERAHLGYVDGVYRAVSHVDDATSAASIANALCSWLAARAAGLHATDGSAIGRGR